MARITRYYHSCISSELPGTRIVVKHSHDELEAKDETWAIIAGHPKLYQDSRFSIHDSGRMFYDGRPLYNTTTFSYDAVKVGDYVTQEVVDDAMDCLPPACMRSTCSQMGEPYSSKYDERSDKWRNTYATFCRVQTDPLWENNIWRYCGNCFCGETEERGKDMPIVAASNG